jgi:hypothetical protein
MQITTMLEVKLSTITLTPLRQVYWNISMSDNVW